MKKILTIILFIVAFLLVARLDNVDSSTSQATIKDAQAQAQINIASKN